MDAGADVDALNEENFPQIGLAAAAGAEFMELLKEADKDVLLAAETIKRLYPFKKTPEKDLKPEELVEFWKKPEQIFKE